MEFSKKKEGFKKQQKQQLWMGGLQWRQKVESQLYQTAFQMIIPLIYIMQPENQNDNFAEQRDNWSIDWWKTEHSNSGKLPEVGKFANLHSDHHTLNLFHQELDIEEQWDEGEFNRKGQRKMQNKINAKKARERKKQQFEQIKQKNKLLEEENQRLRESKVCRRCLKKLDIESVSRIEHEEVGSSMSGKEKRKPKEFVFREFEQQKENRRGKLWIAIGILMLVLGLQIHGIFGSEEKYIKIPKNDIGKLNQQFTQKEDVEKLSIRMKSKKSQYYPTQNSNQKSRKSKGILESFEFQEQEEFEEEIEDENEDKFTFDKDLLYAIEAEFEGIGRYI